MQQCFFSAEHLTPYRLKGRVDASVETFHLWSTLFIDKQLCFCKVEDNTGGMHTHINIYIHSY